MRHSVDFLYSLYDALVSINVPSDKARAVVDAMERDMETTLATKQDLQPLATREAVLLVKQDLQLLATREELLLVKQDLQLLGQRLDGVRMELSKDIEAMRLKMTVQLGAMMVVAMGLLFAALKMA